MARYTETMGRVYDLTDNHIHNAIFSEGAYICLHFLPLLY